MCTETINWTQEILYWKPLLCETILEVEQLSLSPVCRWADQPKVQLVGFQLQTDGRWYSMVICFFGGTLFHVTQTVLPLLYSPVLKWRVWILQVEFLQNPLHPSCDVDSGLVSASLQWLENSTLLLVAQDFVLGHSASQTEMYGSREGADLQVLLFPVLSGLVGCTTIPKIRHLSTPLNEPTLSLCCVKEDF